MLFQLFVLLLIAAVGAGVAYLWFLIKNLPKQGGAIGVTPVGDSIIFSYSTASTTGGTGIVPIAFPNDSVSYVSVKVAGKGTSGQYTGNFTIPVVTDGSGNQTLGTDHTNKMVISSSDLSIIDCDIDAQSDQVVLTFTGSATWGVQVEYVSSNSTAT